MPALKIIRYGLWAAIAALGLTMGFLLLRPDGSGQQAGTITIGGPFRLTDHNGQAFDSKVLAGKPYALFFGFTHCPDVCPTTLLEITNLLAALGPKAKDFRVLFVSVDPSRDTPQALKEYLSAFDARITGLTGTEAEIAAVAKAHRAIYRRVETPSSYVMDHTAAVYLFNGKGGLTGTFDNSEPETAQKQKLERLLAAG